MVVLTIVAQKNGETVYFDDESIAKATVNFDQPIPKARYMRLVSCSLYNSWHNLKKVGEISAKRESGPNVDVASIPEGHYNLVSLVKELKSSIDEKKSVAKLKIETYNPNSALTSINP